MAKSNMDQDILKVLYSEEQLKTRVQEMGDELYERLKDKNPLFLGVLKGSFIFMADIVRACQLKSDIEFIAVSSYQNATTSSGVVQITRDLQQDITGRDIVVIEDILDSGNTLYFLKNYFMTKGASSVTVVTLLDKPARRTKPIAGAAPLNEADEKLLNALYAQRKRLAGKQNVPAFMVFSDATLREMVEKKPLSLDELLNISGVGEKKAARYGTTFLRIIEDAVENRE